ncbi:MAG: hypothetical protein MAG451_00216 [Anaerolineales bacterium]|nr:hypothetical protein [Anaerolineales bacterium]
MKDTEMFETNIDLQAAFMQYVIDRPEILDQMPDNFRLLILSEDDAELNWRNLELLKEQGDAEKPLVIVRMQTRKRVDLSTYPPQIYTPIAA